MRTSSEGHQYVYSTVNILLKSLLVRVSWSSGSSGVEYHMSNMASSLFFYSFIIITHQFYLTIEGFHSKTVF